MYPYRHFEKVGVPPVDRGLLMCYNLTYIKDANNRNSIFSLKDLKLYLNGTSYPILLDIGLPVFGWYAWISERKFKGIIYPDENVPIESDANFTAQGNNYILRTDTSIGNNYLREGDIIRVEYPGKEELLEAARLLHKQLPGTQRVSFYHWDSSLINKYEDVIHQVYTVF